MRIVREMLRVADLKPGETLFDLGAGDGRVIVHAARRGVKAVGIEVDPLKVAIVRARIRLTRGAELARVRRQNFFDTDLRSADVVFSYLSPVSMERLGDKFFAELAPGARVVSYRRAIPGWELWKQEGEIYAYKVEAAHQSARLPIPESSVPEPPLAAES